MSPSQPEFLKHIRDECEVILETTKNKSVDAITSDAILSRALLRSFGVIGEAVKNLEKDLTLKYPQIDRREIAGMRDKVIHDYFGVDYDIVYSTIQKDIPELLPEINRIIELESKR